jgi:sulfide:quinone oxidoreductase
MSGTAHFNVLIVGGGTGGITVAASLLRRQGSRKLSIGVIEPAGEHYYQPAFTLVGAGAYSLDKTRRSTAQLMPAGVEWIRDSAATFDPDNNAVTLAGGDIVGYDYLVVCPGLCLDWNKIDGAEAALGSNGVCSNYDRRYAKYSWECLQNLKPGATALFTQAPLPFKCPGAPQKMAYLSADYLRKKGIGEDCELHFLTHAPGMFAVPLFAKELVKVAARHHIDVHFEHNLVAVDGANRKATFEVVGGDNAGSSLEMDFDMLHATPPQSPPEEIRNSPLANDAGFVDLDQGTLRHVRYSNVFGLGDAGSTPNSKTAAAVRKQSPVVVRNLLQVMSGGSLNDTYDGYASCPLTTAYGKVLMAEFCYGGKVTPTFPLDPRKERWSYWWIKATGLPFFYWHYMLKGREWFLQHNVDYVDPTQ